MTMSRSELEDLVHRFLDAFNREDLDAVMSFFAEESFYDEFNGRRSQGREAIRAAFVPQFRGDFGRIRFLTEDLFVDSEDSKALIRWVCTLERDGRTRRWRGLDVLQWSEGKLTEKHTYAKAPVPLLAD
jgi:uncharacterized protein (TIGR02246 family)